VDEAFFQNSVDGNRGPPRPPSRAGAHLVVAHARTFAVAEEEHDHTMRTAPGGARKSATPASRGPQRGATGHQLEIAVATLEEAKAEAIVTIDLAGKTSIGDYMVIATGRSDRHVGAIADQVAQKLKDAGVTRVRVEGQPQCDWVIVDTGDLIVHVFRPEVREFYNLERMWSAERPKEPTSH
jgi:ribosome-associated protein